MATKKGRKTKTSTAKATTSTSNGANSEKARLTRGRSAINAIAKVLTKGSTVVEHTVRTTLKHPLLPKGVVVACFARQNYVVALLPVLGGMLKIKETDRNGTPFVALSNATMQADATALGKRIATALKPTK